MSASRSTRIEPSGSTSSPTINFGDDMTFERPFGLGQPVAKQPKRARRVRAGDAQGNFMPLAGKGKRLPIDRVESPYNDPILVKPGAREQRPQERRRRRGQGTAHHDAASR